VKNVCYVIASAPLPEFDPLHYVQQPFFIHFKTHVACARVIHLVPVRLQRNIFCLTKLSSGSEKWAQRNMLEMRQLQRAQIKTSARIAIAFLESGAPRFISSAFLPVEDESSFRWMQRDNKSRRASFVSGKKKERDTRIFLRAFYKRENALLIWAAKFKVEFFSSVRTCFFQNTLYWY
jgi:hypothetical protein